MNKAVVARCVRAVWNGPFFIGPLTQPISFGSALMKILEVMWRAALLGLTATVTIAFSFACWSLLAPLFAPAPRNQEECIAAASLRRNSAEAEADCMLQFPAVWKDGGYALYVPEIGDWVEVSSPQPTQEDYAKVEAAKKMAAEQDARRQLAMSKFKIRSYKISCNIDDRYIECYDKNITVNIVNDSDMEISGLSFEYEIGKGIDCSGSLGKSFSKEMSIAPHSSGSFVHNVTFEDAGPNGVMNGCLKLKGVQKIE